MVLRVLVDPEVNEFCPAPACNICAVLATVERVDTSTPCPETPR